MIFPDLQRSEEDDLFSIFLFPNGWICAILFRTPLLSAAPSAWKERRQTLLFSLSDAGFSSWSFPKEGELSHFPGLRNMARAHIGSGGPLPQDLLH